MAKPPNPPPNSNEQAPLPDQQVRIGEQVMLGIDNCEGYAQIRIDGGWLVLRMRGNSAMVIATPVDIAGAIDETIKDINDHA